MRTTRVLAPFVALVLIIGACSDSSSTSTATSTTTTPAAVTTSPPSSTSGFTVQPGTEQVAVLDAKPGTMLHLVALDNTTIDSRAVDEQGSLLFRNVQPASGYHISSDTETSELFTVASPTDVPPSTLYQSQDKLPAGGFGYITTRDGTTLSANVLLPGPPDGGPYPTVVEYSGYQPSDPGSAGAAQIYTTQGFAYVGVNMRGTGCSGGSYRFFETVQNIDGYDVIEAVAAQPWVLDHEVGMVGISYPGLSQLFVAATQPPSLEAISPLSVIDDSYRSTLYPGGILNTGFAVEFVGERVSEAAPYGQAWTKERADAGDTECADNQQLRLQNPDLVQEIDDNPYYSSPLGDSLAPITFVDRIEVPVFLAGAWQDEQTGGHFPVMLPEFTGSPHVYATLTNGLHLDALSPPVLERYIEFLQLYVAKKTPDLTGANALVPVLGGAVFGVSEFPAFEDRFAGMTYDEALAAFEADKPVRVLFEQGGAEGLTPGTPEPNFVGQFDAWPIPEAQVRAWQLDGCGCLTEGALGTPGTSSYTASPDALPAAFYPGGRSSDIWKAGATYDWQPLPEGTGLGFVTTPLTADTIIAGSGSVDLWVQSSAADTDLEVTISEVRPDGTEIYVQSGWLRASQRALDEGTSTELRPAHTNTKDDAADLPPDVFTPVRVELFPFAHPFRVGSRIRLTIDAPGNNRPVWVFDTISNGETVTVAHDADHPSRLVLSQVPGITAPAAPPACGSLRGQPCRTWVPAANGG